jgi:hypothetical protein
VSQRGTYDVSWESLEENWQSEGEGVKMSYVEHKFKSVGRAKSKQTQMKKAYGYKPEIFKITPPLGESYFMVVQPKKLKRIR